MRGDFGAGNTDAESAMVAALVEAHRSRQRRSSERDPAGTRERVLGHFERRGQRLRGENLVTNEIVARLFEGSRALAPARVQQELEIRGEAGRSAAGRFRVTNRARTRASFELVIGEPLEGERRPSVRLEPRAGALAPGESCLVRIEASLSELSAGDRTTLPLECRWPNGADRLWLVVDALAGSAPR
jgi:hypothetical protein